MIPMLKESRNTNFTINNGTYTQIITIGTKRNANNSHFDNAKVEIANDFFKLYKI